MTEVLEHLNFNPISTLKKINRLLKPGGSSFLSTPDADSGWGRTHKHYENFAEIPDVNPAAPIIEERVWQ
jgi:2-polyprenyl-3-methyl-5-hydroxy-6-metoxy-1,4-benzoquinol methylase